ncbi:MAG: GDSL family lipase [Gemmataceae bacterium]|nr:GDSL family lipase [Gemmataceae bacterium]
MVFLGDSITDGWRGKAGKAGWDKHFAGVKVANFGIGGDRTQHVLWRIQNGELDGVNPKGVVLMIGTNNTGNDSVEEIAAGVAAIVKTISQKAPKAEILVLGVFPRSKMIPNPGNTKIIAINKIITKLDNNKEITYQDIGAKFLKDGQIPAEIMPDYLHLSEKGYQIWGDAIGTFVQNVGKKK